MTTAVTNGVVFQLARLALAYTSAYAESVYRLHSHMFNANCLQLRECKP